MALQRKVRPSANGALVLLLAACADAAPEAYRTVETDTGSTLVRTAPLADVPRWRLDTLWTAQPEGWAEPSAAVIGGGRVAVVDPAATRIELYRLADGEALGGLGAPGEGPGEWPRLVGAAMRADSVVVSTGEAVGLRLYGPSGQEVRTIPAEPGLRLASGRTGAIVGQSPGRPARAWILMPDSGEPATLDLPDPAMRYPSETYGSCFRVAPARDGLVRLTCSAGRLEFIDRSGSTTGAVEWPEDPRPATEPELDAYLERFWAMRGGGRQMSPLIQRQLEGVRDAARVRPIYADIVTDPGSGSLLVIEQPFGEYGEGPAALHLLDPEGRHTGIVETGVPVRSAALRGDTVAVLARDPTTHLVRLIVARLVQPPE